MLKDKKYYILYFPDGSESRASRKTAFDIYKTMNNKICVQLFSLSTKNLMQQINKINKDVICILATHGDIGENGTLQSLLELKRIKYTHSRPDTCSILSNKHLTKLMYCSLEIPTPSWYYLGKKYGKEFIKNYVIKKPLYGGSKFGIKIMKNLPHIFNNKYIYEKYIRRCIEISISIIGNNDVTILKPIIRKKNNFGKLEIINIRLAKETLSECKEIAIKVHSSFNCYGITKTDFLLDSINRLWTLETDIIPGLARDNATVIAAIQSGISYENLIFKLIEDIPYK